MLNIKSKKKPRYISSEIRLKEQVEKDGHQEGYLYPCYINDNKDHHYALFTEEELSTALKRGAKYVEESIPRTEYWITRLLKLVVI